MAKDNETGNCVSAWIRGELHPEFHAAALRELAEILGIGLEDVPLVFRPARPKALKIGIYADIQKQFPAASALRLGAWFCRWCGTWEYLSRVRDGINRHDLDGINAGLISDADRAEAADRLARRKAKARARRQAAAWGVQAAPEIRAR
jgi:sRNA-binding protein